MGLLNIFKRKDDFNSQASSYLSEAKELADILNVANDPNEYFKAYNELIEILHKLISFENHVKFKGKMPSEILDDVLDPLITLLTGTGFFVAITRAALLHMTDFISP